MINEKKTVLIGKIIVLIAILLNINLAVGKSYSQQEKVKNTPRGYIKEEGWEIPGLACIDKGKILKEAFSRKVTVYELDELKNTIFVEAKFFLSDEEKEKSVRENPFTVKWLVKKITKKEACS